MAWKRKETYFAFLLIWKQNYSKLYERNLAVSLTLTIISRKIKFIVRHKFSATESVNNLDKKAENPRSGRKLIVRCPDNEDALRDFVVRNLRNPSGDVPKNSVFHVAKNPKERSSAVPIQKPDQV